MGQDVSCMVQSCSPSCQRHQTGDAPYDSPKVAKCPQRPHSGQTEEEDSARFEENGEIDAPHLPESCRCLEQGLNHATAELCGSGEAEEQLVDLSSVTTAGSVAASYVARRPMSTSPASSASVGGMPASSTACSDFTTASSVASAAASYAARRPISTSPASSASVAGGMPASSAACSDFTALSTTTSYAASAHPPQAAASIRRKVLLSVTIDEAIAQSNKPPAPGTEAHNFICTSPSSASTATPTLEQLFDLDGQDDSQKTSGSGGPQDEHDRAVNAFLKENGFTDLTRRRRSSLVGYFPLHSAASQGLVRMTDLMIKAGADVSQKNSLGQTAADIAKRCNRKGSHDGVLDVLQRAAAAPVA